MMEKQTLPRGWARASLGSVLPLAYGKALAARNRQEHGAYHVYGSSGVVGNHTEYLVKGPCLIVGRKGSAGRVFFSQKNCWPIDTVYYTEPNTLIELKFFEHLLSFIRLDQLDNSTAIPSLSRDVYNLLEVPIPPLNEQHRIVSKIEELFSELDEGEAALKKAQKLIATYRQSVLKSAVTGELTKDWREANRDHLEPGEALLERILNSRREQWQGRGKYKEPQSPDTTNFLELPEGWVWATPEQLTSSEANALCIGPFGSNLKVSDYRPKGIPLIFVRHIRAKCFDGLKPEFISREKAEELSSHKVIGGDLLITKMGDPPGDVCIYPEYLNEAIITADCIRFSSNRTFLDTEFLELAIGSNVVQEQIHRITKGVAQQKVTLANFKKVVIPIPSQEEQSKIADIVHDTLSQISALETWCKTELARSATLRQAILKYAFSGKLVPQDPTDEPASVLLERIQADRAAQAKATHRRTRGCREPAKQLDLL